jgi:hypothetical protein
MLRMSVTCLVVHPFPLMSKDSKLQSCWNMESVVLNLPVSHCSMPMIDFSEVQTLNRSCALVTLPVFHLLSLGVTSNCVSFTQPVNIQRRLVALWVSRLRTSAERRLYMRQNKP